MYIAKCKLIKIECTLIWQACSFIFGYHIFWLASFFETACFSVAAANYATLIRQACSFMFGYHIFWLASFFEAACFSVAAANYAFLPAFCIGLGTRNRLGSRTAFASNKTYTKISI